jgi:hypothetical protein
VEEFIRSHVKALQATPGARPPRLASCLAVEKIATQCVAAHAGVGKGDLLAFVDGGPASRLRPKLYEQRSSKRLYSFYSTARSEAVELATTGIEIGVELALTSDAIRARYKPEQGDPSALEKLWQNRQYPSLLELSAASLKHKENAGTPALLFEGIGLWETGHHDEGLQRVNRFFTEFGRNWTMQFATIALHYMALEKLRKGQRDEAIAQLKRAFEHYAIDQTADALKELTGVRPPMNVPKWVGRKFPADYALPILEGGSGSVSLQATLGAMDKEKLLVVCLLASYRSNGPYGDFLQRWLNYATWFRPFLHGLHVITMESKRYEDRAWHYKLEDDARAAGLPFELLLDASGEATMALSPEGSPFVLVLDCAANIVNEGDLGSVELWDTLASISA